MIKSGSILHSIIEDVTVELKEKYNYEITTKDLYIVFQDMHRVFKRLMGLGHDNNIKTYVRRFEYPGIGFISLNVNRLIKFVNGSDLLASNYESTQAARRLKKRGWSYIRWYQDKGFLFKRKEPEMYYLIDSDKVNSIMDAYYYFDKIYNEELISTGVRVVDVMDIKPIKPVVGEVRVFGLDGKFKRKYETLGKAIKDTYFPPEYVFDTLLYNSENPKSPRRLRREIWFIDNEETMRKSFRGIGKTTDVDIIFDLVDGDTGEMVIQQLGTASDVIEYIKVIKSVPTIRTSLVYKSIRLKHKIHGYRVRKSAIQVSKY